MRWLWLLILSPLTAHAACVAGSAHDYHVGTGFLTLDQVPWNALGPGDSVRIDYAGSPYQRNFAINAHGTAAAPVTVCGIAGPNGELPVLEGNGAHVAASTNWGRASASATNQSRAIIWIGSKDTEAGVSAPSYITVSGLILRDDNPTYTYTDSGGASHNYTDFGACVWIDVGHNVTIDGAQLLNCSQGVYSRSLDNSDCTPPAQGACSTISTNTVVRNSVIDGYGIAGDDHEHGMYIQSAGTVIENNWIKQPWPNAGGNAIKDRSTGTVIRYNTVNSGAFAFDLVEAEDWKTYAQADPTYRKTYIYGNLVNKSGLLGFHYGFDNDSTNDRAGTVYVWDDTFDIQGDPGEGVSYLMRLASINDHAEMWNDVYKCDLSASRPGYFCALRTYQDDGSGGSLNLGVNWIDNSNGNCAGAFCDGDGYHPPSGPLTGASNVITGLASPLDANFIPIVGGAADNSAQAQLPAVSGYPVQYEPSAAGVVSARPSVADLGAIETGTSPPPQCGPAPPDATQTVQCPAGTTGTWTQTHGWDSAPYPTCWTAQPWQPTSPPPGACTPIPPPPTTYKVTIKAGTQTLVLPSVDTVTAIQITLAPTPVVHWHVAYAGMTPYDFSGAAKLTMTQLQNGTKPPTIITPPSGGPAK